MDRPCSKSPFCKWMCLPQLREGECWPPLSLRPAWFHRSASASRITSTEVHQSPFETFSWLPSRSTITYSPELGLNQMNLHREANPAPILQFVSDPPLESADLESVTAPKPTYTRTSLARALGRSLDDAFQLNPQAENYAGVLPDCTLSKKDVGSLLRVARVPFRNKHLHTTAATVPPPAHRPSRFYFLSN